jgi:uncharacterized protein (DUF2147 family)
MIKFYKYKIYCILLTVIVSFPLASKEDTSMIGYWLTSQSIVHIKICEEELCGTIEHIFVDEGVDPKSILDKNNKKKTLKERSLVGVNLLEGFKYIEGDKELSGGKIYDPGRGKIFKSNLYILDNGNLKVEGCLLRICGHEEWKPIEVTFNEDGSRSAKIKE